MKIQEEELLPNEWQKRMIRRCGQSLVGPAINHHSLQGWDDGQLQLELGFLQENRTLATPKQTQSKHFALKLNILLSLQLKKKKVIKTVSKPSSWHFNLFGNKTWGPVFYCEDMSKTPDSKSTGGVI